MLRDHLPISVERKMHIHLRMLRKGFLAVLYFIYGFRLRMIQRLELFVAKTAFDIVHIFSDRYFLQKEPGGIQHLRQR